jgi:hypothetical protein
MFRTKFRFASDLSISLYNDLKDILEESYIGPTAKAFNRNSFQKILNVQRPRSWEQLSPEDKEKNFDVVYNYIYNVVYPKTKGLYQKEYVKEKYESGQVATFEKEEKELQDKVESSFTEYMKIVDSDKERLRGFINTLDSSGEGKKASAEDMYEKLFEDFLESLDSFTFNADDQIIYDKHEEFFDENKNKYDVTSSDLYRNRMKDLYISEYKSLKGEEEKQTKEEIKELDEKIDREETKEILKEQQIPEEQRIVLDTLVNVETKTEKLTEKVKEEQEAKSVLKNEVPPQVIKTLVNQPKEEIPVEEVENSGGVFNPNKRVILEAPTNNTEKLSKWLAKKEEGIVGLKPISELDEDQIIERLKDTSVLSKKIINIVKEYEKRVHHIKNEDGQKIGAYNFRKLMDMAYVEGNQFAKNKIELDLVDLSTAHAWTWYEKEYYRIIYKQVFSDKFSLNEYEKTLNILFKTIIQQYITLPKQEKAQKELERDSAENQALIQRKDYLKKEVTGHLTESTLPDVQKDIETALDKKEKNETLNILDLYIIDRIEKEKIADAKYKIKYFIGRVKFKLSEGKELTEEEKNKVLANIALLPIEQQETLVNKIDYKVPLTSEEFNLIFSVQSPYLNDEEKEIVKTFLENKLDKDKIVLLKKEPEKELPKYTKELAVARSKKRYEKELTELESELLIQAELLKAKQKVHEPSPKLLAFMNGFKADPVLSKVLAKILGKGYLKDYNSFEKKVLHETYSYIVNEDQEDVTTRNKNRIRFLFKEAIKETELRKNREVLHETLEQYSQQEGPTLIDYLPKNLVIEVDDTGAISKLFSMYDNKLSNVNDKIDIQEDLISKFELIEKKIYADLKAEYQDNPAEDSQSYIIFKKKLMGLIAAIALETGLRPSPAKEEANEFGGQSQKKKLKKDDQGEPELKDNKKQYVKELVDTYGIATLKAEHIKFFQTKLVADLKFLGKRGVENATKLDQADIVKQLKLLVESASGDPNAVNKCIFVLPNGKKISNTDIVVYFESLARAAGLKKLRITDFRKLKAVRVIHASLLSQRETLYRNIAKAQSLKTEEAKIKVTKLVLDAVSVAYKKAQKSLSHSTVNETINSYVNPNLLLNFLSTGKVEDTIDKALLNKSKLQFDPEVFITEALAFSKKKLPAPGSTKPSRIQQEETPIEEQPKDTSVLQSLESNILQQWQKIVKGLGF